MLQFSNLKNRDIGLPTGLWEDQTQKNVHTWQKAKQVQMAVSFILEVGFHMPLGERCGKTVHIKG